jgi:hypothetical protein
MLLFKRIFSLLSGFNCLLDYIWTALMNKQIVLARTLDRSFPTQTVIEGRDPGDARNDGGLHDHWVLMGG